MKKIIQKSLLATLIVLIFAFPITEVHAQAGQGTCSVPGGSNFTSNLDGCRTVPGATFTPNSSSSSSTSTTSACDSLSGLGKIICQIHEILNSIIPVLVALGVVYFVWGVVQYVVGDGEEAKKKGKDRMIYGVIGLAVIVGVFGLVNIVVVTFGIGGTASIPSLAPTGSACVLNANGAALGDLFAYVTCYIGRFVIPLIFALAVLMFVWGVVQFVINSDEEAKREKGRQFMIWGIIGLTVMISVWGLVAVLSDTFHIGTSVLPKVCPPGQSNCP